MRKRIVALAFTGALGTLAAVVPTGTAAAASGCGVTMFPGGASASCASGPGTVRVAIFCEKPGYYTYQDHGRWVAAGSGSSTKSCKAGTLLVDAAFEIG
ncbi:hypothetical protein GT755_30280 [Herbidospora sp. NEAU-GS84]|uniref:Ig-like domain-containing protein n=1 Tax=Herbidospora solisilvae TaxID=2696284 RepID=A0A7C9NLX5_9ACTN|nr:hypothetical protein [Herbidospora solisilvae]NAS25952.1 hypothetical protein [Herbidospora solisilvae]